MRYLPVLFLLASPALADTHTFQVYSYQRGAGPCHSHTWAVFTRTAPDGRQSQVTISWMPAARVGGVIPGRNWTQAETLAHAHRIGAQVFQWGPYPCSADLWERARQQATELSSGRVQYVALDRRTRPGAMNCISAVLMVTGERVWTRTAHGHKASAIVVGELLRCNTGKE